MSKYRVTLTIHETGGMSKEDFRRLQEAVNQIAEVTEFKLVIDEEAMNIGTIANLMGFVGPKQFTPTKTYEQTKAKVDAMLAGTLPKSEYPVMIHKPDTTLRDTYGHDLPEDEKALSSHN